MYRLKTRLLSTAIVSAIAGAGLALVGGIVDANPAAAQNPCNPCNPCGAENPCEAKDENPCAAKAENPCAGCNPCNPDM